jgi:hypothetical protein
MTREFRTPIQAPSIVKEGGTSSQFLMADGTVTTGSGVKSTYSSTAPISPAAGDMWIDTSDGTSYTYVNDGDSNQWVELNNGYISGSYSIYRYKFIAVGGETSVSGPDASSQSLSYTVGNEQVYLNGVLLVRNTDYTASTGTSITGLSALTASDILEVISFASVNLVNVIPNYVVTNKGDLIVGTAASTVVNLAAGTDGYFLKADSTTAKGLTWSAVDLSTYLTSSTAASTYSTISSNNDQDVMQILGAY